MKNEAAPRAGNTALAALAGSILLASLGTSITTVALPTLARAFSAGVQQVQWIVLAYLLVITAAIVIAGRLGDLYGSRRVLVAGLALFTVASAGCVLAPGLGWLVAGRVVQGLGAAALMSLPLSIAKGRVAKTHMGRAMGLLGAMSAVGTALGPSLGGVLIGALGWRAAFAVLAVCGAGVLLLVLRGIPSEAKAANSTAHRLDWAGGFWLSLALLCFALSATGSAPGLALQPWMLLALAAIALVAFIRNEMAAAHPLVPVALVRGRATVVPLAMNLLIGAVMMSTLVVGPFFLSSGLGLSEAGTGMVMAVGPVIAALAAVPAGWVTDRIGAHRALLAGLLLAAGGLCGFAVLPIVIGVPGYALALALITPGFQLFLAANNTAVMAAATDQHKGLLSGLLGLTRNLGFMVGASLLPRVFASRLGGRELAAAPAQMVGEAFSTTFLVAAGLCVLAIVLALLGNMPRWLPRPSRE